MNNHILPQNSPIDEDAWLDQMDWEHFYRVLAEELNSTSRPLLLAAFEQQPYFTLYGRICGFPDCCILNFVENAGKPGWKMDLTHPMCGTGYVPCAACLVPSKEKSDFIQNVIMKRRLIPLDFPEMMDGLERPVAYFHLRQFKERKTDLQDLQDAFWGYASDKDMVLGYHEVLTQHFPDLLPPLWVKVPHQKAHAVNLSFLRLAAENVSDLSCREALLSSMPERVRDNLVECVETHLNQRSHGRWDIVPSASFVAPPPPRRKVSPSAF